MIRRQFLKRSLMVASVCALGAPFGVFLAAPQAHAAEDHKKGGGPGYTQFPLLTVFTSANSYRHGTLSLDMGIYAADPKLSALIKMYMPRLQDAYITRLQVYATTLNARSMVDTDYVSSQLQNATNQVLGRTDAKVLLGSVLLN